MEEGLKRRDCGRGREGVERDALFCFDSSDERQKSGRGQWTKSTLQRWCLPLLLVVVLLLLLLLSASTAHPPSELAGPALQAPKALKLPPEGPEEIPLLNLEAGDSELRAVGVGQ